MLPWWAPKPAVSARLPVSHLPNTCTAVLMFLASSLMLSSMPAQGIGNLRDLRLRTSITSGALNDAAKLYGTGNLLSLTLDSPGATLIGAPAIIAVDLRLRTDNNVFVLPNEPLALGIGPSAMFLIDGTGFLPTIFPGLYTVNAGGTTFPIPLPDLSPLGPVSILLQGATADGGAPNGLALTRTVRHDPDLLTTASALYATEYAPDTFFGYGLWVADVNNDGFADVISGMYGADPGGVFDCGEVRIYYGPNQTTSTAILPPLPQASSRFGSIVRSGDVTGDGIADIIVGARLEDLPGAADAGAVYVFRGPTYSTWAQLSAPVPQAGARLGFGLTLADWDHDGIKDVCVGAARAMSTSGVSQAGKIFIFRGGPFSFLGALDNPLPATGDKFGDALIGADFTGDGLDDLFIGAPGHDTAPQLDCGAAFLFPNGSTTASVTLLQPPDFESELGNGFAAADMNQDGHLDLVAPTEFADGAFTDSGQVQIIYGPSFATRAYVDSPSPGALRGFGSAIAAGDVNRDGYPDLVVGEMYADILGQTHAGQAWAILGPSLQQSKRFEAYDPALDANFGRRIACADVNNDGFLDVIVAAPLADPLGPSNNHEGEIYIYR